MNIFAISDLHLSISTPEKTMEVFSPIWKDYHEKIKQNWLKVVSKDDLVLIPGDISWAMHLKEALIDLEWIHALPGKKIILKGNHDYWWPSKTKLKQALPPSIDLIQNSAINFNNISIGGTRLWDTEEYNFDEYIEFVENPNQRKTLQEKTQVDLQEKIYKRELERLLLSLDQIDKNASIKIAITHYPPIGADLNESKVSKILKKYDIHICVFGHLHNLKKEKKMFGKKDGIKYILTSADYISFLPVKVI